MLHTAKTMRAHLFKYENQQQPITLYYNNAAHSFKSIKQARLELFNLDQMTEVSIMGRN
jgi:hypothetical protein